MPLLSPALAALQVVVHLGLVPPGHLGLRGAGGGPVGQEHAGQAADEEDAAGRPSPY